MKFFHTLLAILPLASAATIPWPKPPGKAPSPDRIHQLFRPFLEGNGTEFYNKVVSPNVHWTVMGSGRMAGEFTTLAAFVERTRPIGRMMASTLKLDITGITQGHSRMTPQGGQRKEGSDWAIVELKSRPGTKCKNGMEYNQIYSWSTRWQDEKIVEVRAYLDTLLLETALRDNEGL